MCLLIAHKTIRLQNLITTYNPQGGVFVTFLSCYSFRLTFLLLDFLFEWIWTREIYLSTQCLMQEKRGHKRGLHNTGF